MDLAVWHLSSILDILTIIERYLSIERHVSFYHPLQALFRSPHTHQNILSLLDHSIPLISFGTDEMA